MRKLISSILIEWFHCHKEAMLRTIETSIHFQKWLVKGMEPLNQCVKNRECTMNDRAQYLEWIEKQVQEHAQNEDMRSLKPLFHQYQSEFSSLIKVVLAQYESVSGLPAVLIEKYSARFNILIENYVLYQKFLFKCKKMFVNNRKERMACIFKMHALIGKVAQIEFQNFMLEFYSRFEKEILAMWTAENLVLHFKDLLLVRSRFIELRFVGLLCFIWQRHRRDNHSPCPSAILSLVEQCTK